MFGRRIRRDERGATAIIFALVALLLVGLTFGVIDVTRLTNARLELRDLLDAATLAAARSGAKNDAQLKAVGQRYLAAEAGRLNILRLTSDFHTSGDTIVGTANGVLNPIVMGLFMKGPMVVSAETHVERDKDSTLELALVLDTTGSMEGAKIEALKSAAKNLVQTIMTGSDGAVKVAVVPFANYVNIGVSRRNQPWADVPADSGWRKFHGCVGSPPYPQNVRDSDPSRRYPGFLDEDCTTEFTPLTDDQETVVAATQAFSAHGNTYIPGGLAWGFNMLSPQAPMTEAAAYDLAGPNRRPRKVLVLMTDGANTLAMNRADGSTYPVRGNPTQANKYTKEVCNNIKAAKIEVFSIAFAITEHKAKKLVQNCASDDAHFIDAKDPDALIAAFKTITESLQQLHISH
jgi:Flp pilus assembly protein TadG